MHQLPTGTNDLANLGDLSVQQYTFSQILDYGRYDIRIDPTRDRGYYATDLAANRDRADLIFTSKRLVAPAIIPLQVKLVLHRAGYDVTGVAAEA